MRKLQVVLFLILILVIGLCGCSVENKLNRKYHGMSKEELVLEMGRPTRVESASGGGTVNIYEKTKILKATPINTGQIQYDKYEISQSVKIEIFKFYFNSAGTIEDVKYESSYQR